MVGEGERELRLFLFIFNFYAQSTRTVVSGLESGAERKTDRQTETWGEREADRQRDRERGSTKAEKIIIISTQYRSVWSNIRHAAQMKASPTAYL